MTNLLLRAARQQQGWSQQQLADLDGVSLSKIERAERGDPLRIDNVELICSCFQLPPEQLGLIRGYDMKRREANKILAGVAGGLFAAATGSSFMRLWADDLLSLYTHGIAACQDLYHGGDPHHVEAILPLYCQQTASFAQQSGPLQPLAARLAAQAYQLACELSSDREDFWSAYQAGQQAYTYAQLAGEINLQISICISLANLGWHLSSEQPNFIRKHSKEALLAYERAVSLFQEGVVSPLLKGRTYAGLAEVYALRGQSQDSLRALGLAYEHFPLKPEEDPAYAYRRTSRYSLYVFGDAQSRLLLGQPKEAEQAMVAMRKEMPGELWPLTKVDFLYYQAEIRIQQNDLEAGFTYLAEGTELAKKLGSRLYLNKLAASYHRLEERWPGEPLITSLSDLFQNHPIGSQ